MTTQAFRILFFTRERFPTHRVDVNVLFGHELIGRGHAIDLVMQAETSATAAGPHDWYGRTVYVGKTAKGRGLLGRLATDWLGLSHDIACLRRASPKAYDAIQVRDKFFIAVLALLVARLRGLKFFFWLSFPLPEADLQRASERLARYPALAYARGLISSWLLYRWILPGADHAFVQSERMKQDICARGIPAEKVTPVPMGVDLGEIPDDPPALPKTGPPTVLLGYLGLLSADRRLGMLLDMLTDLRKSGVPAQLLLIGDAYATKDRASLERRAAELGIAQFVEITGFLPRKLALERMRTADIALSPIYPSPMFRVASPTKLVEYLALRLPVVANDQPEQKLILRESRAGVCTPWGARHFARSIRWLMRQNDAARREFGLRGRAWVEQHRTYTRIADEIEKAYLQLLPAAGRYKDGKDRDFPTD
jgi:glycosyltransferase involved in cell wall biosynthesis